MDPKVERFQTWINYTQILDSEKSNEKTGTKRFFHDDLISLGIPRDTPSNKCKTLLYEKITELREAQGLEKLAMNINCEKNTSGGNYCVMTHVKDKIYREFLKVDERAKKEADKKAQLEQANKINATTNDGLITFFVGATAFATGVLISMIGKK